MKTLLSLFLAGVLAIMLGFAIPVEAVDGVIEINQVRALEGGVTSTDDPGFPVILDSPGSYRLTTSLVVPDAETAGIFINADDVTLDLNGFSISGPTSCTGGFPPLTCSPTGNGDGVWTIGSRTTITNGSIVGMGQDGIRVNQEAARIHNIHVSNSGRIGISAGPAAIVTGVTAYNNGQTGISAGFSSVLNGNTSSLNDDDGFNTSGGVTLKGNSATHNGGSGIATSFDCTVAGNTVENNGEHGISACTGSNVYDNVAGYNSGDGIRIDSCFVGGSAGTGAVSRNTVLGNSGNGISVDTNSSVVGNTAPQNTGFGLVMGNGTGYVNNVVNSNTGGTVSGGVQMGANVCNGDTTCP
jgi:hypothetical protein